MHTKNKKLIVLAIILLLSIIGGLLFLYLKNDSPVPQPNLDSNATDWNGNQKLDMEKMNPADIELPCFEKLIFSANQTEQKVNLYNPKDNPCYLQISLTIEATVVWESEMLEPDKGFYTIQLSKPLDIGHYTGYLNYKCYSLDDLKELNGANVAVKIIVQ